MAERAMVVTQVSLEARRCIIKEAATPSAAFRHMHKLCWGAIGIKRENTNLCLRLIASLSQYPSDHPLGKS